MRIDITGYVTELHGENGFKIKVTSDSLSDIQVSKEVEVYINPCHYPNDYYTEFKSTKENKYGREQIDKCISLSKVLKMGDQIECSVFIVDPKACAINRNPNDLETYAKFPLWLYPNSDYFRRSESDSRKSLKFRKQWRYTCINREKYEKIKGYLFRDYWWINKNPTIILPIIGWIWIKTAVSNLWKRFTGQKNPIAIGVISLVATVIFGIIGLIVTIWFR